MSGLPVLAMWWRDLLFAHWPVPPEALATLLPAPLRLDLFDGRAWLGIVPFRMTRVRPLGIPLPGERIAFAEVNVRTYVRLRDGTPAVWFLSLDGQHRLGAAVARLVFGVPYHDARVVARRRDDELALQSRRRGSRPAEVLVRYRATGPARPADPGGLDAFLTDRPALVVARAGRLWRTDVEHEPWRLRPAEAAFERTSVIDALGLRLPAVAPHLRLAEDVHAIARRPRPAERLARD